MFTKKINVGGFNKPLKLPGKRRILTKKMIEDSQSQSKSATGAARWLEVSYNTYKKWAKYYGVFEQHKNPEGFGIKKGWATHKIPLERLFSGGPIPRNWSRAVIKKRLINEGYLEEECAQCGYNETNLNTDLICLAIDFIDGDTKNWSQDNIRLLCPNCHYSFNAFFNKSKVFCK